MSSQERRAGLDPRGSVEVSVAPLWDRAADSDEKEMRIKRSRWKAWMGKEKREKRCKREGKKENNGTGGGS